MLRIGIMMVAATGAMDPVLEGIAVELLKLGAVGAIALYLIVNDRRRQEASDSRWAETNEKLFGYLERNTKAHADTEASVRELTEELRHRPCLKEKEHNRGE